MCSSDMVVNIGEKEFYIGMRRGAIICLIDSVTILMFLITRCFYDYFVNVLFSSVVSEYLMTQSSSSYLLIIIYFICDTMNGDFSAFGVVFDMLMTLFILRSYRNAITGSSKLIYKKVAKMTSNNTVTPMYRN
uniref:Uncharacterized protein n=1 Tax=Acrobeloides nanus TaxID=290746 RepID=A0A914DH65_9BILA